MDLSWENHDVHLEVRDPEFSSHDGSDNFFDYCRAQMVYSRLVKDER